MKLSQYAKKNSIVYQTAWNHFREGKIPGAYQLPSGTVVIPDELESDRKRTIVYSRVSSSQNRSNLKTQSERVSNFCSANGWIVDEVVEECASGLNDTRPKLLRILQDPTVKRIVVEHKDRLTRFGFKYIETLFDGEIVVINESSTKETELMEDLVSIITSFCARLYGHRRTKRKTEAIIEALNKDD